MERILQLNPVAQFNCYLLSFLCLLFLGTASVNGQNVTIRPSTGSMIASTPTGNDEYDTFFKLGGFATWRHEQLCLTMTTSDFTTLTENGQLANPANNIYAKTGTDVLQLGKGNNYTTYMAICLPKGYRFTGYSIVFARDQRDFGTGTGNYTDGTTYFGETDSRFEYTSRRSCTYGNTRYTLTRTSQQEDGSDMGNILYFKLAGPDKSRAVITLHSVELFFTAEANFTPVLPSTTFHNRTAVDVPFATSKVDYGNITNRHYNGVYRISYSSANVLDLKANLCLYEEGSVKDGTDFDGTSGKVVDYQDGGTISSYGTYFKLGKESGEQVYYIETPTYVTLPDAAQTKNPVGYRIVGASISYARSATVNLQFYIKDNRNRYLNTNGRFTTSQTAWQIDEDGHISSGGHYIYRTSDGHVGTTTDKSDANTFEIVSDGIRQKDNTNSYIRRRDNYGIISSSTFYTSSATCVWIPTSFSSDYTLKVYDKMGTTVLETVEVNASNPSGTITLDDLNNDAVKFSVEGVGLVNATLTMQALDPYINRMTVVCRDKTKPQIHRTQTFTASDFSVSGGEFHFYLPDECVNDEVKISFEDLNSNYADESYDGGSAAHKSRFNFVKSQHYNMFGESDNNIYNNTAEAASSELESARTGNVRTKVGIVGDKAFRFNNADQFSGSGATAGYLIEYPFTLEKYAAAPNSGMFGEDPVTFTVSTEAQKKTSYVFTTDETRYNIAPTTASQHRVYSFYRMVVVVQSATYTPQATFTKVYSNTFYDHDGSNTGADKPFYGVTITATDSDGDPGYVSDTEVKNKIAEAIGAGGADVPESTQQILYVDLSKLAGAYENTTDGLNTYKSSLAKNALIFLPKGLSYSKDNFAYQMESGDFRAANNIIITDKQPFYTPYKIQVDEAHYALYQRKLTKASYLTEDYATIIMPFTIALDGNGQHVDEYGTMEFLQMNANDATSDANDDYGPAVFFSKTSASQVAANTPYALKVVENLDGNGCFTLCQRGSDIEKTPDSAQQGNSLFSAQELVSTGNLNAHAYTFTHKGSFSGTKTDRNNPKLFYFARNGFYASEALDDLHPVVKLYPFRSVYQVQGPSGAKVSFLAFVEGVYNGEATGMQDATLDDGGITVGRGTITIASRQDACYRIRTVSGQTVNSVQVKCGETRTISVPAGIYLVNGQKVCVK